MTLTGAASSLPPDMPRFPSIRGASHLSVNGMRLYQAGEPVAFDAEAVSHSMRDHRETHLELTFSEGIASTRFWTSDLTLEYVKINADYHT